MSFNEVIALTYAAMGGMTKLITLKHPTPGRRYAAIASIVAGAITAGWIGALLPQPYTKFILAIILVFFMFEVAESPPC